MKDILFSIHFDPFSAYLRRIALRGNRAEKPRPVMGKIKATVLFAHKSLTSLMIFRAFRSWAVHAKFKFRDFPGLSAVPVYAALTGSAIYV